MNECSYTTYVVNELKEVNDRLRGKIQNQVDLYFLKNLGVMFKCSWQETEKNGTTDSVVPEDTQGGKRSHGSRGMSVNLL
jgi:hypothetical protein